VVYTEPTSRTGITHTIMSIPEQVLFGQPFTVKVKIKNQDDEAHSFDVWSYVYRGSKSYSGAREENKITSEIGPGKEKTLSLKSNVQEGKNGIYKVKVKIRKDEQKTTNDFTREILITQEPTEFAIIEKFDVYEDIVQNNLQLYVDVKNIGKEIEELEIILYHPTGKQEQNMDLDKGALARINFSVQLLQQKYFFILKLSKGDHVFDVKELIIQLDEETNTLERTAASLDALSEAPLGLQSDLQSRGDGDYQLSNPRIVYQSTSVRAKKLAPWIYGIIVLSLVSYLVMRKL